MPLIFRGILILALPNPRGAQGVETGTRGTLYFDDFESRRFSYIGTLTDPGVNDPTATNPEGWFARTYTYSASIPHAVTRAQKRTRLQVCARREGLR